MPRSPALFSTMREPFTDETPMPWGEHKGIRIADVSAVYLQWLLDQTWIPDWPEMHRWLKRNQDTIKATAREQRVESDEDAEGYSSFNDYMQDHRGF